MKIKRNSKMKKHQCPKCKKEELVWDNEAKKYYCLECDKYFKTKKMEE